MKSDGSAVRRKKRRKPRMSVIVAAGHTEEGRMLAGNALPSFADVDGGEKYSIVEANGSDLVGHTFGR
jgi:hypothetical protein